MYVIRQGRLNIGNVNKSLGSESVSREDLEVIAIGKLASSTCTIVGVVCSLHILSRGPVKVVKSDHAGERR